MRLLKTEHISALFSTMRSCQASVATSGVYSVGRVYCLDRNLECVPFSVGASRFLLEVKIPYFLTQADFHEAILLATTTGGVFIPKLEHRHLTLVHVMGEAELVNLCQTPRSALPPDTVALSDAIREALIVYYRSYPNANQYFYMVGDNTKPILRHTFGDLPADFSTRYELEQYPDLAEPYAGFTLTSKAL